jgi:hypothetical protein
MRYRKLRIAWSVVWGVASVLLIALWVRSYWRMDTLELPSPFPSCGAKIESFDGRVRLLIIDDDKSTWKWAIDSCERDLALRWLEAQIKVGEAQYREISNLRYAHYINFQGLQRPRLLRIHCPYWLWVSFGAFLSFVPWLRWRFSLRTLLIATTLVAVVLGLIVALR